MIKIKSFVIDIENDLSTTEEICKQDLFLKAIQTFSEKGVKRDPDQSFNILSKTFFD